MDFILNNIKTTSEINNFCMAKKYKIMCFCCKNRIGAHCKNSGENIYKQAKERCKWSEDEINGQLGTK